MFKLFKPRRLRTLAEVDSMSLEDASKLFEDSPLPNIDNLLLPVTTCKLCQGELVVVVPELRMGELILKECSACRERFYV
jgi:hypothetical protein